LSVHRIEFELDHFPSYLPWLSEYRHFCLLLDPSASKASLAIGASSLFMAIERNALGDFSKWLENKRAFGYISYDLKNEIEALESRNPSAHNIPEIQFFEAECLIEYSEGRVCIDSKKPELGVRVQSLLLQEHPQEHSHLELTPIKSLSRDEYLNQIKLVQGHLQRGDIYEMNFCQEFVFKAKGFDPYWRFHRLTEESPMPFSSFMRFDDFFSLSASPERFLKREGTRLLSEPIKGSLRRSTDLKEDLILQEQLKSSKKDKAENIMIVDLVRNDLSRVAEKSSVQVEALNELHSFKGIHQLISRVSCEIPPSIKIDDILKASFPMGSMTGAPKVSSMKIIEDLENFKRSIFSGSIGHFQENGDFDLNVVIRSLFFSEGNATLSYAAGGAITILSDPAEEYEESLLKLKAIRRVLEN